MFSEEDNLKGVLAALQAGRLKIRVARTAELFRRRPRSYFHATPEFFLQTGGASDFECPGGDFRLNRGEVCVMPSGVPHAETPRDRQTPYGLLVFMQARDGFFTQRAMATAEREIAPCGTGHFVSARGRSAFRYLDEMAVPVPEKHRKDFENSLLEVFLITILDELNRPAAVASPQSRMVGETEKLARSLLPDPGLSVAGLAATLGCSADHLSRRFHRERGQTLTGWIARERVAMARELLVESRYSIAEVGWACGFSAPSYFIRVFREQMGLTPRAYRLANA